MDQLEVLEKVATVRLEGAAIAADQGSKPVHDLVSFEPAEELFDGLDEGRIADDPSIAVDDVCQLVERLHAVPGARLGHRRLASLLGPAVDLVLHLREQGRGVQACVPNVQIAHLGELTHRGSVGTGNGQQHASSVLHRVAVVASGDRKARHEPLHVPLPRPRQGFVEVVHVEHQSTIGRTRTRRSS